MWQAILDALLNFFRGIGDFAGWLTRPIEGLGMPPLAFFTIGGFAFIVLLWVVKLINPID